MCYLQAFRHHDDEGMRLENAFQLSDNRINISMLVRLYVPALLQATEKYDKKINKDFLDKYYFDELNDREYGKSLKPVFSASEEFREALADFLQKRGYTEK